MTPQNRHSEIPHLAATREAPLSFQQDRVLYLNRLSADGPLWNRVSCKALTGRIDQPRLKRAVDALVERHAVLKTRIELVDGEPYQWRHESVDGALQCLDVTVHGDAGTEEHAREILNREYAEPFALEGGPLFKAVLLRCGDDRAWLVLKLHHIISDATTLRILWRDLKALYNAGDDGTPDLHPLPVEYFDYARWVRTELRDGRVHEQETYWLEQFAGELPELDLPADAPVVPDVTFKGAVVKRAIPRSLLARLQSFSLERRVIPFSTLLSGYYLLLHHYCRQDDLVIGTVFSGRHYSPQLRHVAGFFSNTVALRARVVETQPVGEFVQYVHGRVSDAHAMQDYPFERLVSKLGPNRQYKRNPLFRAMFNMVTAPEETETFEGIRHEEWREPDITATQVDLFLDVRTSASGGELRVEFNTDLFERATIDRMLRHYLTLLEQMMMSPTAQAGDLRILDAAEEKLVLALGEGRSRTPIFRRGIVEMLEERASTTPNAAAVRDSSGVVTCAQLNTQVNRLAAALIDEGVAAGDVVAIMSYRSVEMVVGLLAILKTGAAYLPIDPAFPAQRIAFVLTDSGTRCLLVQNDEMATVVRTTSAGAIRCLRLDDERAYRGCGENIGRITDPSRPAYVLYTSGSTGLPKGVVVQHGALMNTLECLEDAYGSSGKTILLKTNFTFDVSAAELFGWLFGDGTLAVLDKGAESDPAALLRAIDVHGVTHINFVPSMLDVFLSGLHDDDIATIERLEYVFVAGEPLTPELANRFHATIRGVRLEDLYGPTEAAIYATCYSLQRGDEFTAVPIGKPISNTRAYVVDERLRLLPVGMTGELCLSGPGLAQGYLNQPGLTRERFCPNPYWEGERLYRTGDLARWGDDGLIHYVGRRDGQLKVRGFRVEIDEVQRKLLTCSGVAEAAVRARTDRFGQKALVAYVSIENGNRKSIETVRAELAAWLPDYMVPEFFVELERLPRLPSGKVDLQALPTPDAVRPLDAPRAAATELERIIIEIAEGVLNTTGLDPSSNFFRLGGNSLMTLRFIAALDAALGTHLSVIDFLALPTIAEIAELIGPDVAAKQSPGAAGREQPEVCVTP